MPARETLWMVCYDIADPRRLGRVARFMEKHGIRVQYSVFILQEKTASVDDIALGLSNLIDERHDDIRIYPVAPRGRSVMIGATSVPPDLLPRHPAFRQLHLPFATQRRRIRPIGRDKG